MVLKIERFQPEGMNVRMSGGKPSYSHVVTVSGSDKIVYTAGQLARDIDGNCVGEGDMRAQMEQTFQNLDRCLKAAGAAWAVVVKTNTFITEFDEFQKCADIPHALSRGGDPDQHDRRRHPSRRTRSEDRRNRAPRGSVATPLDGSFSQKDPPRPRMSARGHFARRWRQTSPPVDRAGQFELETDGFGHFVTQIATQTPPLRSIFR